MAAASRLLKEMLLTAALAFALALLATFMWTAALRGHGSVDVGGAAVIAVVLGITVPLARLWRSHRRDGHHPGRESSAPR